MENSNKKTKNILSTILTIIIIVVGLIIYNKYDFYDYTKAEYHRGLSKFERDSNVKCTNEDSFKIINESYNDAVFFKTIDVIPNTPYKVTCKIKTEDVVSMNENTDSGAHICLEGTVEKSDNVIGTTDWTQIVFYFNSKNNTQVNIGFRLGGVEDKVKGTAWFSDFSIESGIRDTTNNWNFLCLLFDEINVNIDEKNVNIQLKSADKEDILACMRRFKTSIEEMSERKIEVEYDIIEVKQPIENLTYDEVNGYYVSAYNVKDTLDKYIKEGKYDHIFIIFRTGDLNQKETIPINDWIGLGYMEYRGLGFSNIRLPDDEDSYIYKYDTRINTFPEEVPIHEFLHTLEKNAEEYGYERPELHDNEKYGYESKKLVGLQEWYKDYMNKKIKTTSGNIGLPEEVYTIKPVKSNNFEYSHKLNYLDSPSNIIEQINNIINKITKLFTK